MAVSALPAHMVGITTANPSTAEAMRASETSLTARAESRARVFGPPLEWAMCLLMAADQGVEPGRVNARVEWASLATRSQAQEADAVVKLHGEGILTTEDARKRLGLQEV